MFLLHFPSLKGSIMATARTPRIYPLTNTFKSYPITDAVAVERVVINPDEFDYYVSIKIRRLFGGHRVERFEVSQEAFNSIEAYLASKTPVTTP